MAVAGATAAASEAGPPESAGALLALLCRGLVKRTPWILAKLVVLCPLVWLAHSYLLVYNNDGYSFGPGKALNKILALGGFWGVVSGTAFWTVLSLLCFGLLSQLWYDGLSSFFGQILDAPLWLIGSVTSAGIGGLASLAGAGTVALAFYWIGENALVFLLLAAFVFIAAAGRKGGILYLAVRCASRGAHAAGSGGQGPRRSSTPLLGSAYVGLLLGFLAAVLFSFLPGNWASWTHLVMVVIGMLLAMGLVVVSLAMKGSQAANAAKVLVLALGALALLTAAGPVFARDDGSWSGGGGSFVEWLKCEGVFRALLHGVLPALGFGLGSVLLDVRAVLKPVGDSFVTAKRPSARMAPAAKPAAPAAPPVPSRPPAPKPPAPAQAHSKPPAPAQVPSRQPGPAVLPPNVPPAAHVPPRPPAPAVLPPNVPPAAHVPPRAPAPVVLPPNVPAAAAPTRPRAPVVLPPNVSAAAHVPPRPPAPVVLPPEPPAAAPTPPKAPAPDLEANLDEELAEPPKTSRKVEAPPAAAAPESEEKQLEPTLAVGAEAPPASKMAQTGETLPAPPPAPEQVEAATPSSADVPVGQVQDASALSPASVERGGEEESGSLTEDKEMVGSWSVGAGEKLLASAYNFPKPAAAQALAGANHALAQVLAGGLKAGVGKAAEADSPLASWAALDKTSAPLAPYRHPPGWGPQAFRGVARCTLKARARQASVAGGAQGAKGDYVGNG